MFEIAIANEQSSLEFDPAHLQAAVEKILADAGLNRATISIAVVDDPTMHNLNRQFLSHDYPTDVLSFVLEQDEEHLDGEIIASADYAIRSAGEYHWPAEHELLLYVIHGTLHLIGHDDLDDAPREEMRARERHYLLSCGVTPPGDAA